MSDAPRDLVPDLTAMLFVPACRPRMIEKARTLDADAVIVDLEDGTGVGEKSDARAALPAQFAGGWPDRPVLFVRVNGPATDYFVDDVTAAVSCRPYGICVPKCETADDVKRAEYHVERAGGGPEIRLLPFVESALGVLNAYEIASASERVVAIALGSEDLAADVGLRRTKAGAEIQYYRGAIATAARAAGVLAIDAVFIDFNDPEGLASDAATGRASGFAGKQLIHPSQIAVVKRAFAPTPEELAKAGRIVAAFDAAEREGTGVVVVDGQMIDRPVVLQARRLLDRG
jgi:citrate lyase subunit beta / citryl-CoA lyase